MPVLAGSAYTSVDEILSRARVILNDAVIAGGDVLTNTYPGMSSLVNLAYANIQKELTSVGVEVFTDYVWLMAVPVMPTVDPEARLIITDTATNIIYPSGIGDAAFVAPQLPSDMIEPLELWERQNGTANRAIEITEPNDGLSNSSQGLYLMEWEWGAYQSVDALMFRGALQVQDVKIKYVKQLPRIAGPLDPVPLRGVDNAAAYQVAKIFATGRGSTVAASFGADGKNEIFLLQSIATRKGQRKRSRRQPYSGRTGRHGPVF
jgi:hypothetical protein